MPDFHSQEMYEKKIYEEHKWLYYFNTLSNLIFYHKIWIAFHILLLQNSVCHFQFLAVILCTVAPQLSKSKLLEKKNLCYQFLGIRNNQNWLRNSLKYCSLYKMTPTSRCLVANGCFLYLYCINFFIIHCTQCLKKNLNSCAVLFSTWLMYNPQKYTFFVI